MLPRDHQLVSTPCQILFPCPSAFRLNHHPLYEANEIFGIAELDFVSNTSCPLSLEHECIQDKHICLLSSSSRKIYFYLIGFRVLLFHLKYRLYV